MKKFKVISSICMIVLIVSLTIFSIVYFSHKNKEGKVVVTIFPIYDICREILGTDEDIVMLQDNGADMHSYQATASDIATISKAELFIMVGGESDSWVGNVIRSANNVNLSTVSLMDIVAKVEESDDNISQGDDHHHEEGEDHHHEEGEEHHEEDIDLICEVGCTTIRLAHYQHAQYFYDLCDERGLVIWAEIPYISKHMPTGRENTISQMKELITQNYNHPSIVVWGLSNEISIGGADDDLLENHRILNDLCHEMDKTRLTTIAAVSMCKMDDPYLQIPDVVSYNHYFGWYGGDTSMNGPWFDNFHKTFPNIPIGVSEYGCEALNWHTSNPQQGDYTEEYQAYYHEELIKQLFSRKYIWATHVWNMFDFGADARAEGGENGQNHKGLMTFDRKYKKDSFYAYKAWLSDDPFVHICGKRYVDRVEDVTKVTVYSNLPEVELFANGVSLGKQTSDVHFFYFDVPNTGVTNLVAVAGECKDESHIRKVDVFNEDYRLKEKGAILNWFDITEVDGYLSLNDKMSELLKVPEGQALFGQIMGPIAAAAKQSAGEGGFEMNEGIMQMMGGFTVLRLIGMLGMTGLKMNKEELLDLNAKLNQIKKA